jgi:uncharacterized membrane protein YkvA (DUF1232 family)
MLGRLKRWARVIRRDLHATWLAARDPRVPWHAKAVALFVTAYAFSPIDLIPDFVPVLGYLDDLIIVPIGLWLAIRLIPPDILEEHRAAAELAGKEPVSKAGAALMIAVWLMLAGGAVLLAYKLHSH